MVNFAQMMQKAQMMKKKMAEMQEHLKAAEIETRSNDGHITLMTNGKHEIKKIIISDALFEMRDKETLEDLIAATARQAHQNVEARIAQESKKIMDELGLPPQMLDQLM